MDEIIYDATRVAFIDGWSNKEYFQDRLVELKGGFPKELQCFIKD